MIKNIVLDFGGVVLTDDDVGVLFDNKEIKERYGVSDQVLHDAWVKYWHEVGEGRMTIFQFYDNFQKEISGKVDGGLSIELFKIYKSRTRTLEPYDILPNLKRKYKILALTNIFKEGYEFKREKYGLDNFFEMIIASCEVGVSKPNQDIFQILLDRSKIIPEESLFVDDREKNTVQASKMGFNTLLYDNFTNFKEKLIDFGIKYE
ncbi:MAG: HAD-IA family hydrolase [bacterium]|nr:MAG: HAD-IA family hydrolase [bacterium]